MLGNISYIKYGYAARIFPAAVVGSFMLPGADLIHMHKNLNKVCRPT